MKLQTNLYIKKPIVRSFEKKINTYCFPYVTSNWDRASSFFFEIITNIAMNGT